MPRMVSPGLSAAVYTAWFACEPECGCTFAHGAPNSFFARSLMPKLAERWGQAVVIENRPGAGGSLAAQVAARAAPDGHTLLVHSAGYAINAALNPALPYDPYRDLVTVAPLASQAMVLVV